MEFGVGSILEGKVTGITKFGAFVSLPEGKSGLVHISEIAYSYVNDVKDHLKEGQEVKVKVIGIDENGRINHRHRRQRRGAGLPGAGRAGRGGGLFLAAQPVVSLAGLPPGGFSWACVGAGDTTPCASGPPG